MSEPLTQADFDAETIVAAFQQVARPIMLRFMAGDRQTCIACTRITIETMRCLGLDAEPVSVQLVAQCPELKFAYISGFSGKERRRIARRNGKPIQNRGTGGYNGHVIAAVAGRWLIDSSIDQVQCVEKGLRVEPSILVIPLPESLSLKRLAVNLTAVIETGQRLEIQYRSRADSRFAAAEAWEFGWEMKFVTAQILDAMTTHLQAKN
jgi:hypothetical protein